MGERIVQPHRSHPGPLPFLVIASLVDFDRRWFFASTFKVARSIVPMAARCAPTDGKTARGGMSRSEFSRGVGVEGIRVAFKSSRNEF